MLDLLASWPFCSPQQLAGLLDGVTERRANQVLRSLRAQGLIQREDLGYVLSEQGLTTLARRDRADVGPTLDRWTPQHSDDGAYFGTVMRALTTQSDHQRGITEFAARLTAEAARNFDYELLALLPTYSSQITYWNRGPSYVVHPDVSFQLGYQGDWDWCLLEYERRAVMPKRVPEHLRGYPPPGPLLSSPKLPLCAGNAPPPADRNAPLLSNDSILPGPLSANVGKLLQNADAARCDDDLLD